jgi:uncharacterized membrane protein (DUF485 family)
MSGPPSPRNARIGLRLFAVYLVLYTAFVLLNALRPDVMEETAAGVNLAVLSGFGLIAGAFVIALAYGWLCRGGREDEAGDGR